MTRRRRALWLHGVVAFVLIPAAVFAVVWTLNVKGGLFRLQTLAYDAMITRWAAADPDASPVVIVAIDETDVRRLGQYPIGDRQMVDLLNRLETATPRAIGIDIYRDSPTATKGRVGESEADYTAFNQHLLAHPNTVVVYRLGNDADDPDAVPPPAALAGKDAPQQAGASALAFDDDGVVRRAFPFLPDPRTDDNAIALGPLLAFKYLAAEGMELKPADDDETQLILGKARLTRPLLPAGFYTRAAVTDSEAAGETFEWMVDFRAPEAPRVLHWRDVMNNNGTLATLKDKIVLVGVFAKSVKDEVATPFSRYTKGPVMHGYVADQLVRWAKFGEQPPTFTRRSTDVAWVIGWAVVGAVTGGLGITRSLLKVFLLVILELLILTAVATWALRSGTILPFVAPLLVFMTAVLASLAYTSAIERTDRRIVQQLINMHISKEVAEQLLEDHDAFFAQGKLAPQRMTATVLFSDLMNFTPIAERLDSAQLMDWLNEFFTQMTRVVEECGGIVNKFNGDQVMALFGPPGVSVTDEEIAEDARAAVRCAVLMRRELATLNTKWAHDGLPTPLMRIGVFTGPLVAGTIGGQNRVEYTVIGDTVNAASRLESSNKEQMDDAIDGTRIIIGDATCAAVTGHFQVKGLGLWELKGRTPVPVHAVLNPLAASGLSAAESALPRTSQEQT